MRHPVIARRNDDGTWPPRPTNNPDIMVIWMDYMPLPQYADPASPMIVWGGVGGMHQNSDILVRDKALGKLLEYLLDLG
jgi:ABC-type glycerol-3-phosphate transport system substrate-binding protein